MSPIEIFSAIGFDWKSQEGVRCSSGWGLPKIGPSTLPRPTYESDDGRIGGPPVVVEAMNQLNSLTALRIGHAFRKNAAGAFGPDLAKKLSQLVKMEKNAMRSMELVARERMEVAVCGWPWICDDRWTNWKLTRSP